MTISSYHNEIYAGRARDLYILIHYPDEHFKLNFKWKKNDIKYWKNKLITNKNKNKWIPLTNYDRMKLHKARIIDALLNNNIIMLEKLHIYINKKNNSIINDELNALNID
jgi:hypothetical protein